MAKPLITVEQLREMLCYDVETGVFTWRTAHGFRCSAGGKAGSLSTRGYTYIKLLGRSYQAHRLAWLYVHGEWPEHCIDHINGVHDDNRLSNLRDVTLSVNAQNKKKARADNSTGFLGVTKRASGYLAQIMIQGQALKLGIYADPAAAHAVYLEAKRQMHSGCTI